MEQDIKTHIRTLKTTKLETLTNGNITLTNSLQTLITNPILGALLTLTNINHLTTKTITIPTITTYLRQITKTSSQLTNQPQITKCNPTQMPANFFKKPILTKILLVLTLVMISACEGNLNRSIAYNAVGFEEGGRPSDNGKSINPNTNSKLQEITAPSSQNQNTQPMQPMVKVAPDYYYRQPSQPQPYPTPQPQPVYQYQQPYPTQPQAYQQQPYYAPPAYAPQQQYQPRHSNPPGSRFYSNPYAIPPSNQYPYQDADQYYVPPTHYQNVEQAPAPRSGTSGPYM